MNRFKDKKSVLKNFAALTILQGTNFLIPLIIMPYLTKTIGIEGFGLVSFIQTIMFFFTCFTDFGFNISATRDVAIYKDNHKKLSEIFSLVMSTKLLLTIFSILILLIVIFFIPSIENERNAYIIGFTSVIGQVLLPVWFFQGVQEMKYISYLNLLAKIIFTILIFTSVKESKDYYLVLLFLGLGNVTSGLIGLFWIKKKYEIKYFLPQLKEIKNELKNGWSIFISNFSIVTYIHSNLFILGLFTNNTIVGIYSIAEKIYMAMKQPLLIFSQAVFPRICELSIESHNKIKDFYRQLFIPFIIFFSFVSIGVFIFSNEIIELLSKSSNKEESVYILKLLCLVPIVIGLNIPAYQTLLAYQHHKNCSRVLISGSILNLILNLLLTPILLSIGTTLSVIITELFITISLYLVLKYKHKEHWLFN